MKKSKKMKMNDYNEFWDKIKNKKTFDYYNIPDNFFTFRVALKVIKSNPYFINIPFEKFTKKENFEIVKEAVKKFPLYLQYIPEHLFNNRELFHLYMEAFSEKHDLYPDIPFYK